MVSHDPRPPVADTGSPEETPPSRPPRWPWWTFRVLITITAVLVFDQAIFAGQFLSGNYAALLTHRNNALAASVLMFLSVVSAVLVRRPGRGPIRPLVGSLALFVLLAVQYRLGFGRVLAVHIPLGVTIIGLTVALAWWAWRTEPAAVTPPRDATVDVPVPSTAVVDARPPAGRDDADVRR